MMGRLLAALALLATAPAGLPGQEPSVLNHPDSLLGTVVSKLHHPKVCIRLVGWPDHPVPLEALPAWRPLQRPERCADGYTPAGSIAPWVDEGGPTAHQHYSIWYPLGYAGRQLVTRIEVRDSAGRPTATRYCPMADHNFGMLPGCEVLAGHGGTPVVPSPGLDPLPVDSAVAATIDALRGGPSRVPWCIGLGSVPGLSADQLPLATGPVHDAGACPPDLRGSWIQLVDSLGNPVPAPPRPPGHLDPMHLGVKSIQLLAGRIQVVIVGLRDGETRWIICEPRRPADGLTGCATLLWLMH